MYPARKRQYHVLVKVAVRSLLLHKLRSLLTVLGLVFGVASVVVMLAIAEGASRETQRELQALGVRNIYLNSVKRVKNSDNSGRIVLDFVEFGLTLEDVERMLATVPSITEVIPARQIQRDVHYLDREEKYDVVGVWPNFVDGNPIQVVSGRFIQKADLDQERTVCVISVDIARQLFGIESPLYKTIKIDKRDSFTVVGVWDPKSVAQGSQSSSSDDRQEIYIPLSTDLGRFGERLVRRVNGAPVMEQMQLTHVLVQVDLRERVGPTATVLKGLLDQYHPNKDYDISVPLELLEQSQRTQRVFTIVVGSIAAISLLVGGIGIMNIMLATVSERTREIGIRRALGARRSDIIVQFLVETVTLSMIGAVIGLILGVMVPLVISRLSGLETHISIWSLLVAVAVAIGVGVLFGIYPARRAAYLDPVEALQHD